MTGVVLAHAALTWAMFGLMWSVQLVVYPQFRLVDPANFSNYATEHARRITAALVWFAPAEILLAAWLWLDPHPALSKTAVLVSGVMLAIAWLATGLHFAPAHGHLRTSPYDRTQIDRLIRANWGRTVLWLVRAIFAAWFVWQVAGGGDA